MNNIKRIIILLIIVAFVTACSGNGDKNNPALTQYSNVTVDSVVVLDLEGMNLHPVFTEDDKNLLYTNLGYNGIFRYNINAEEVDTITSIEKSGYSFALINNNLYFAFNNYNSENKSRSAALIKHDMESGEEETIYQSNKRIQGVTAQKNDQLSFFVRDSLFIYNTRSGDFLELDQFAGQSYLISKGMIRYITRDGITEHLISDKFNIVDVEPVSPDSVLINLAGQGLFLFNPKTGSVDSMNTDFFPRYDGHNLYAFTYQATDGHKIDTSRVFIKSLDGSIKTPVSTDRLNLDENPAWSHNGRMIAYNNFNGQLKIAYLSYH